MKHLDVSYLEVEGTSKLGLALFASLCTVFGRGVDPAKARAALIVFVTIFRDAEVLDSKLEEVVSILMPDSLIVILVDIMFSRVCKG